MSNNHFSSRIILPKSFYEKFLLALLSMTLDELHEPALEDETYNKIIKIPRWTTNFLSTKTLLVLLHLLVKANSQGRVTDKAADMAKELGLFPPQFHAEIKKLERLYDHLGEEPIVKVIERYDVMGKRSWNHYDLSDFILHTEMEE